MASEAKEGEGVSEGRSTIILAEANGCDNVRNG